MSFAFPGGRAPRTPAATLHPGPAQSLLDHPQGHQGRVLTWPLLFPSKTGRQNDPALASGNHRAKSRHTTGNNHQSEVHKHIQQPPIHPSSPDPQLHPMLRDTSLTNAVTVAGRGSTEFRWYPVWVIAIKNWMFPNSNTDTVACNLAPQYALEYTPKPAMVPASDTLKRVILLVENKPKMTQQEVIDGLSPFQADTKQIYKQAVYAFLADPSLHVIGVILAYGTRWRYTEMYRPLDAVLHAWIETGDTTYRKRKGRIVDGVPAELEELSGMTDQSFELLDKTGRSARAFEIIARRIRSRERKMWNL
ncbi:hypothetical protein DFJ58DRAFT_915994 [Suillus subalutaceus]|uniref:uncharacterized protein n=1 Tax=Suillus subalutaceus TaxID=48586 RepID=UPI001B881E03|nr:uncharacterized protein DFJ58DRAFT_915994 [Suillus subalutaceus]KAG1843270.1 hypothetical protein DFJ58DRAFT_915994 [Suillus subalutaceus]